MERDPSVSAEKSCSVYFNSHAHVERDGGSAPPQSFRPISTHTLTWSVTPSPAPQTCGAPISTHTLTWSVTAPYHSNVYQIPDFNSHAHVERDGVCPVVTCYVWNFNSHAHVERDVYASSDMFLFVISTHTLTWSVTMTVKRYEDNDTISTHTLTWSVTKRFSFCCQRNLISTHTLTWSVTSRRP